MVLQSFYFVFTIRFFNKMTDIFITNSYESLF